MTPTERERIEKEAKEYMLGITDLTGTRYSSGLTQGYIAGATAEHDKARNQAIDEMLEWIKEQQSNEMTDWGASLFNSTIKKLEHLKTKP